MHWTTQWYFNKPTRNNWLIPLQTAATWEEYIAEREREREREREKEIEREINRERDK